jgi:hypothetical protein
MGGTVRHQSRHAQSPLPAPSVAIIGTVCHHSTGTKRHYSGGVRAPDPGPRWHQAAEIGRSSGRMRPETGTGHDYSGHGGRRRGLRPAWLITIRASGAREVRHELSAVLFMVSVTSTAGCNEGDPSGLLLGVPRLRGTVIFRVGLLKKHLCVREVAWSNITAKRCTSLVNKGREGPVALDR